MKGIIARRQVEHRRHLDKRDIPGFLLALEDYTGQRQTVIAVKLLMLTAVRPGELCEALWSEFYPEECEWRIPAARMKIGVQHIVPLSRQVLALLEELRQITGDGKFLFSASRVL